MTAQSEQLFNALYYQRLDTTTQIDRLPPVDALCGGGFAPCRAPFCTCMTWKPSDKED